MINSYFIFEKSGRRKKPLGQTSLELVVGLCVVIGLLVAAAKIFSWINRRMVDRQYVYETSRVSAGSTPLYTYTYPTGTALPSEMYSVDAFSLVLMGETIPTSVRKYDPSYPALDIVE